MFNNMNLIQYKSQNICYEKLFAILLVNMKYKIRQPSNLNRYEQNLENCMIFSLHEKQIFIFILFTNLESLVYDIIKYKINPIQIQTISPVLIFNLFYKSLHVAIYKNYNLINSFNTTLTDYKQIEHYIFKKYLFFEIIYCYLSAILTNSLYLYRFKLHEKISLFYLTTEIILNDLLINLLSLLINSSIPYKYSFMYKQKIDPFFSNSSLYSNRLISNKKNNLFLQFCIDYYVIEPQQIYENRYMFYVTRLNSLCCKNTIMRRNSEINLLRLSQLIVTYSLELQDLLIPKIQTFLYVLLTVPLVTIYLLIIKQISLIVKNISDKSSNHR
uniref:Conserved hypothetical plastid protein n=1 Tax=Bulboplastis apyrenoidosa TaxID=1070855 RepID=A0A1Y9TMD8_9RHOD|nr:conserved hypothetical plastid protein [Bulboplastis apyrenoidosa]ARO90827.1 conserved hypothetical plastid protein [Bulboplastis apyrenoidosa]